MSIIPWGWLRKKLTLTDPSGWSGVANPSYSGRLIDSDTVLSLSAAWGCVKLRAETCGTFPLQLFEPTRDGKNAVAINDHPLSYITQHRPNPDFTAARFWTAVIAAMDLQGNAYGEKLFGSQGQVVSVEWLFPRNMRVWRDPSTFELLYDYTDPITKLRRRIPSSSILHIRNFGIGGDTGLSAIAFGANSFGAAMDAEEAAGRFFRNGMKPSGWIKTSDNRVLDDPQREQVRKNIIQPMSGPESWGRVGLLEGGFDWIGVTMNPEDAQLLQTRNADVETVCRWFSTPPILVGHSAQGVTTWGTGIEQIFLGWLTLVIRPLLTNIETEMNGALLSNDDRAAGRFFRFNVESLLRSDSSARSTFLLNMVNGGIYTRNEARAKENLPPLPGGDVLTVQSQNVPLATIGQRPPPPTITGNPGA